MSTERTNEIEATASAWLIRRDSGTWTEADQARFQQWLNASTLHRVAFLRLELVWEDAARLQVLGAGIRTDQAPARGRWNLTPFFDSRAPNCPLPPRAGTESLEHAPVHLSPDDDAPTGPGEPVRSDGTTATLRSPHWRALAVAAVFLLALGIGAYVALPPEGERYTTPIGGLESVPMIDGSRVTLNTDSQIQVALTGSERRVDLKRGEAFFEVSKDPRRPFVVRVGSKRVIAVGTKFSVRRDTNDIEVIVTEGKVRVEDMAAPLHAKSQPMGGDISPGGSAIDLLLTPGSIARASDGGLLVQRKSLPEAEEQLSWRTGVLVFRDQRLGEAIAEFNRYNVRKIILEDPSIAELKIEGNFRATNVEAFVRLLESAFPIRASEQQDQIILTAE